MIKDIFPKYYFDGNYNCAEAIIRAANDYYELGLHDNDMKLMAGFGAGIQSGNTCGAVLSAVSVLSMKYVEKKAHESSDIRPVVNMLLDKFMASYGSVLCSDIKPKFFKPEVRCEQTLLIACDVLEATIAEFESQKNK